MKTTSLALVLALATAASVNSAAAQDARMYDPNVVAYSAEQLDNLVAPIALYPDPILAQALIAATFPDQIQLAAKHVRAYGTRNIDDQNWDVSVKSIAHYPPVLNLLADREDWTVALGQAYAEQSGEVMDAVQRLRAMARAQGNLQTTAEQTVIVEQPRVIRIVPANPRYIYVPTYDPEIVYVRPIYFSAAYYTRYWSFGIGFPIGSWLMYDCDWRYRRVYYDNWYGGGWRVASRPYVTINVVYVHPRYEVVHYNRTIIHHRVNYVNLRRYNTVHRTVTYETRYRPGGGPGPLPRGTTGGHDRDNDHRNDSWNGRRDGDRRDDSWNGRRDDDRGTQDRRQAEPRRETVTRSEPRVAPRPAPRVEPRRTDNATPRTESRPIVIQKDRTTARPVETRTETRGSIDRGSRESIMARPVPMSRPSIPADRGPSRSSVSRSSGSSDRGSVSRSAPPRSQSAPSQSRGSSRSAEARGKKG